MADFALNEATFDCHIVAVRPARASLCSPPMEPAAPRPFAPAEAGALLITITALVIGIATLFGWALDATSTGLIIGVILGVPAGIAGVYVLYRRSL